MTHTTLNQAQTVRSKESYIHFSAADRLGNTLAILEENGPCRRWAEVEPKARRLWEEQHERPWSEFREVVRQAWVEVRRQFLGKTEPLEDSTTYQAIFRRHYEANYAGGQSDFSQYAPAYHYGYDLAVDGRLRQASWAEIEPQARRHWQRQSYAGPWDDFKAAVYYAWSEIRQRYGG